jgi:hypothetical protein
MSAELESFLARWSRRKREAEREAERPAGIAAPELPSAPTAKVGGEAAAGDGPVSVSGPAREPTPTSEVPLPPIESLDGLRSDYQAFFQQPVADELRHAALKKLFADPHFNKMDMLDVYVDDYTQFEPLPAALRVRLPSARDFLSDSERAVLEAAEAPTGASGDASGMSAVDPGAGCDAVAGPDSSAEECGLAADDASVDATSRLSAAGSTAPAASADDPDRPLDVSSPPAAQSGKATASDPSSS